MNNYISRDQMEEERKDTKSSWPQIRKWLKYDNGTDELYSVDNNRTKASRQRRRKHCSEDELCAVVPEELSEEWLTEAGDQIHNLRMFVGTWNVGGTTPHEQGLNLNDFLKTKEPSDIYVLGFQEIVPLNASNVLGPEDPVAASKWLSLIEQTLNENTVDFNGMKYSLVARKQMVGIFLCVWIREDLYQHISHLKISCVGRGIMGYLGNKGAVSISMKLHRTSLCFVCTHLASGDKESDALRRNMDVAEILRRTRFANSYRGQGRPSSLDSYTILDHDNVIWLGDLNYRLSSADGDTYRLIEKSDWGALLEKDQLKIQQRAHRAYEDWEEGEIYFAPTYKYIIGSDNYVALQSSTPKEKRRTPAWCDRILWKGKGLEQMCYSRGESRFSDHRPVFSVFLLQVNSFREHNHAAPVVTSKF